MGLNIWEMIHGEAKSIATWHDFHELKRTSMYSADELREMAKKVVQYRQQD